MGKDDEHFVKLEVYDINIKLCDHDIEYYREQIKNLRKKIKWQQDRKNKLQKEKNECLVEWNMDYKTIEKRLTKQYPEFAP